MLILVSSFPRSGTHLTIDSLCKNVPHCVFPRDARLPRDFNYGSLLRNDAIVTDAFRHHIDQALEQAQRHVVIKSHLMPSVIMRVIQHQELDAATHRVFADIWDNAAKVCVYRDPRDVMVSRYHHQRAEGRGTFAAFLRQPPEVRGFGLVGDEPFVQNRVALWAQHVAECQQLDQRTPPTVHVRYEDLVQRFAPTFTDLAHALQLPLVSSIAMPRKSGRGWRDRLRRKLRDWGLNMRVESTAFLSDVPRQHWDAYFAQDDLDFLREVAGSAAARLGYELDVAKPDESPG